ncbi:transcriptional regulator, SARP family protein [Actinoplanes sp. LDG1-06]|uniref:Transcriptional regulator, SARP family protein n=1 Tax=Paractinoplanes ovalisporus TaxID=2810368 RepID=A0ABS2AF66_9ACTN|nr:BTAD domain-containing putative transcriptional regulator [Actinoplanes ovalisporus]MBM2618459.1 transcriptional regulator, SARP family protein [Actinoplanes ovalisporus]
MDFRLLGPVGLYDGDARVHLGRHAELPKVHCVLAALLLAEARPVTETFLDNALWGAEARNPETRRGYVGDLRLALRRHGFTLPRQGQGGVYRLEVPPDKVDVHRFRAAADDARQLVARGDWAAARERLRQGLQLWHGPALEGVPGDWAAGIRRRLERERREAETRLGEARLRCDDVDGALADAERLVAENPEDERAVRLLMHAVYLAGDYGTAIETYERLAARAGPGAPTRSLADRIRVRDPLLGVPGGDSPDATVPHQLPAVTAHFAGRTGEMARLAELTDPAGPRAPLVLLYGTAGVGKSTLAVHWARSVAGDYPHGQLHADLLGRRGRRPSRRRPADVLRGFLVALGVPPDRLPAGETELGGLFRSLAAGRRMLIVLEDPADDDQVRALLPGTDSCLTVVTSRTRLNGLAVAPGAAALTLGLLDAPAARELLAARLGYDPPPEADEVIRLCDGLPLALSIVAAQAAEVPLSALADQLREEGRRLDAIATGDGATDPRATFAWSYHRLPERAARLFRLLSRHPGPDFTPAAAASLIGEPEAPVADLAAAHLISSPAPGRFTMHALLRAYAAEVDDGEDPEATTRLFDHYLHSAAAADRLVGPYSHVTDGEPPAPGAVVLTPAGDAAASAWLRDEALNLAAVAERGLQLGRLRHAVQIPRMTSADQIRQGRWPEHHEAQLVALAAAEQRDDEDEVAESLIAVARALGWLNRPDEALRQVERAVPLAAGPWRIYRLRTLQAWLFGLVDQAPSALESARLALAAARESGNRRAVAVTLNEVGWWNAVLGRLDPALSFCASALAEFEALDDVSGIAAASDSLGLIHHRAGRFAQALSCYERARHLYCEMPDVFEHAATLDRMGDSLAALGRDPAPAWREALALFNDLQHPDGAAVSQKLIRLAADRTPPGTRSDP